MEVNPPYERRGLSHSSPFSSSVGQQFHSGFSSSTARLDRSNGRSFADFQDSIIPPQDQVVLDSNSGKIILPPTRNDQEQNPLSRFYNTSTETAPWNPQILDHNVSSWPPTFITQGKQSVIRQPAPYPGYREPARSNPDSHITGRQQRDSGYITNGAGNKSVISGGEIMDVGDENQSVVNDLSGMQLQNHAFNSSSYPDFAQWPPEPEPDAGATFTCNYADCKEDVRFKNASELKKHQQRHEKPHKCEIPGCIRKEGFTTKNDLDRHRKSLHGISLPHDRSFRCAGLQCNKRGKIWPRLDNFKSHCGRMHSKENIEELIKKSEIEPSKPESGRAGPSFNAPNSARSLPSNDGSIQDANLLLDLSQGSHNTSQTYQNAVQELGMNRLLNTMQIPHPPPLPSSSHSLNIGGPLPRIDSALQSPPEPIFRTPSHPGEGQLQTSNTHLLPSVTTPTTTRLRSPVSNERLAEKLQPEPVRTPAPTGNESHTSLVTRADLDAFSTQLSNTLTKDLSLPPSESSRVYNSIQRSINSLASTLAPYQTPPPTASSNLAGTATDSNGALLASSSPQRAKRVRCRICSKTMDRPCDLKKHEKRHSRPWGCTNASCNKTFGSKNDWKRHENSQHYQLETWRCHEPVASSKIGTCAKIFFRRDPFQVHLRRDHGVREEEYIREECKKRRIGRNWQNGFWCGFCKAIVKLSTRGLDAWDERFNHIDDLHFKAGQRIEEWYPMDKDLPKGKLKLGEGRRGSEDDGGLGVEGDGYVVGPEEGGMAENDRDGAEGEGDEDDEEEEGEGEERSEESENEEYPANRAKRQRGNHKDSEEIVMLGENALGADGTRKALQAPPPKGNALPSDWYCPQCNDGPYSVAVTSSCGSCGWRSR